MVDIPSYWRLLKEAAMQKQALKEEIGQGRQAESALHRGDLWFHLLLEKLPAGAYTCDPDGLITYFNQNAVQLWGRAPKLIDPVDRFCGSFKLFWPDGSPIAHDQCWMALTLKMDKGYNGHEIVIERPDGQRLTALAHANPIHNESGELLGAVNVLVDITERKRAEEERERLLAQEWKARAEVEERKRISRELHDRVAHAMGVVHQSLELHEALKHSDPETARAKMNLARQTTKEAMNLTRNLSQELRSVESKDGFSAALSSLLETAVPPGLECHLSVEGDEALVPPHVREQLFVILREGVRNAVSHSMASRLDVGVCIYSEKVVGYVEDDGRGFAEEDGGYAGGGVQSIRERAELVGGTLELSSALGVGTSIKTVIPLKGMQATGISHPALSSEWAVP
jgi:PAS domain S-box-containing protein